VTISLPIELIDRVRPWASHNEIGLDEQIWGTGQPTKQCSPALLKCLFTESVLSVPLREFFRGPSAEFFRGESLSSVAG
jgi:hypothetical protein